jgi:hypothetical protein
MAFWLTFHRSSTEFNFEKAVDGRWWQMYNMHRTVNIVLSGATLIAAILSAYYWFKSAALEPYTVESPIASIADAPGDHLLSTNVNVDGIHFAMTNSARLNKWAAIWTGVSALLSAATAITSAF